MKVCPCPVCSRGGDHGSLLLVLAIGAVVALAAWLSSWAGWQRWWMTPLAVVVLVGVSSGVVSAVKASFSRSGTSWEQLGEPLVVGEGEGPVQGGTVRESRDSSLDSPSPTPVDELATRRAQKKVA